MMKNTERKTEKVVVCAKCGEEIEDNSPVLVYDAHPLLFEKPIHPDATHMEDGGVIVCMRNDCNSGNYNADGIWTNKEGFLEYPHAD